VDRFRLSAVWNSDIRACAAIRDIDGGGTVLINGFLRVLALDEGIEVIEVKI
jgi:hypothetical protein